MGAMLGIDMLDPSCTSPTSTSCPPVVFKLHYKFVLSLLQLPRAVQEHDGEFAHRPRVHWLQVSRVYLVPAATQQTENEQHRND
jgi:hypothetical protein